MSGPGFVEQLLDWYARHARDLPWRRTADPYAVWVSEVMLQQTQVATVIPYFERWMRQFPTLSDLAEADEDEVLCLWQGLGYYRRARALLAGARTIRDRHAGSLPTDARSLRELPGIGPYTAGAIAGIAFNLPEPAVDGNVERVVCRLWALRGFPGREPLRSQISERVRCLIPHGRASPFNQALMELGATICTPTRPDCARCPVTNHCAALEEGCVEELPERPPRPKVTALRMAAAIVREGGEVLVVRRHAGAARWAGLWEFPSTECGPDESFELAATRALRERSGLHGVPVRRLGRVVHSVTRYRIDLGVVEVRMGRNAVDSETASDREWLPWESLAGLAMPAAHRRIAEGRLIPEPGLELDL